jgi:hypothetical protein
MKKWVTNNFKGSLFEPLLCNDAFNPKAKGLSDSGLVLRLFARICIDVGTVNIFTCII